MRSTYIICYDIADDKRLRKVFKTMKAYGDHLQYSVFECQLSPSDLIQCRQRLSEIINHAHDQVLYVTSHPNYFPRSKERGLIEAIRVTEAFRVTAWNAVLHSLSEFERARKVSVAIMRLH